MVYQVPEGKQTLQLNGIQEGKRYAIVVTGPDYAAGRLVNLKFRHAGDPDYRDLPDFNNTPPSGGDVLNHEFLSFTTDMILVFDQPVPGGSSYYVTLVPFTAPEY
jgi:hypothetical protein